MSSMTSKRKQIVALGEVLWDLFPGGRKVGGAPGNFAFHCAQLGADASLLSAVGDDVLGRELLRYYHEMGLPTDGIAVLPTHPTGTVRVEFRHGEPCYTICEDVAWDHIELSENMLEQIATANVFYYGSLVFRTKNMQALFQNLLRAVPESSLKVCDVNLRAPFYQRDSLIPLLEKANILKLNVDELALISPMLGIPKGDQEERVEQLRQKFGYDLVILTDGANGSLLSTKTTLSRYAALPVDVVDTVGAGDSFVAQAVVAWLDSLPIEEINRRANALAAFVCTCHGGTPRHVKP